MANSQHQTRSEIGNLVLTIELKRKLAAVKSLKADVSSVSPSSVRLEELWVVFGFICRKWSYAIGGNMVTTPFPTSRHFGKPQNTKRKIYLPNRHSKSPRYQEALSSKQTSNTLYVWKIIYMKFNENCERQSVEPSDSVVNKSTITFMITRYFQFN